MPDDVILEAGATIDVAPYEAGLTKMVEDTQNAATQVKAGFQSIASADTAVASSVSNMSAQVARGFANVREGGIFAFDAVRAKMIEATVEVGRLRNEILSTDDPTALANLRAQLREATLAMTAARTEMRAMRFEAAESTEKMNLLGEAVGVKIPGELGKLLGRMPQVQAAMAAAFEVGIILFFINAIEEGIEKIIEMTEEVGGFGKAAKEAYQEAIAANDKLILKNIELHKHFADAGVIGKEGLAKLTAEAKNSEKNFSELSARSTQIQQALRDVNVEAEKLKSGVHFTIFGFEKTAEGWRNYKEAVDEAEKSQKRLTDESKEITNILQFEKPAEEARLLAEKERLLAQQSIADAVAQTEARKSEQNNYVDFYVSGLKRLFAADQITLEDEVEGERRAASAKLAIEEKYISEREAELRKKAATGADVGPEMAALQEKRIAAEIRYQETKADLTARYDRESLARADALEMSKAETAKRVSDEAASFELEQSRRALTSHKISIDEDTKNQIDALNKRTEAERTFLNTQLTIAQEYPAKNAAQIETLNARIAELDQQRANQSVLITEDGNRRKIEEDRRAMEEEIRFTRETSNIQFELSKRVDDERLKSHAITLSQWETSEREAIGRWYTEQRATYEKAVEEAARNFGAQSLEYRKALNEMMILDEKFASENERINERMKASFQASMNVISHSFTSAFDRMLTEHTRFRAVMDNFWNEMVRGWARMGLQIVADYIQTLAKILIQHIATALKIQLVDQQTVTVKKATENLFDAFLNALGIKRTTTELTETAKQAGAQQAADTKRQGAETAYTAQYIADQGAMTTAFSAQVAARATAEKAADVAVAIGKAAQAQAKVQENTAVAASDVFLQAIESVPFPANIPAAVAASATVESEMAPFAAQAAGGGALGAVGTAEHGALLSADRIVQAHKEEMILPSSISTGLRSLIATGGHTVSGGAGGFGTSGANEFGVSGGGSFTTVVAGGTVSNAVASAITAGAKAAIGGVGTATALGGPGGPGGGATAVGGPGGAGGPGGGGDISSAIAEVFSGIGGPGGVGVGGPGGAGGAGGLGVGFAAPPALAAAAPSSHVSNTNVTHNRTTHVSPNVTINQHGGSAKSSVSEIADAVSLAVRRGMIKVPGAA